MKHLSEDALCRLVDEAATAEEREHLDTCVGCTSELATLRGQTAALAALPDIRPPSGDWEALESQLVKEGLLTTESRVVASRRTLSSPWIRSAAAVSVFLAGAAAGIGGMAGRTSLADNADSGATITFESSIDPGAALARMQDAERTYIEALIHYRQLVAARQAEETVGDPRTRYAALGEILRAGQVALSRVPADPFLNGLVASALAEREAVSRRLLSDTGQDGWF